MAGHVTSPRIHSTLFDLLHILRVMARSSPSRERNKTLLVLSLRLRPARNILIRIRSLRLAPAVVHRIVVPHLLLIPAEGVAIRVRSLRLSPAIGSHVHLHFLLLGPVRVMIDIDNRRLEPGTNACFHVSHWLLGKVTCGPTRIHEGFPFRSLLIEPFERMLIPNNNLRLIPTCF